MRFLSEKGKNPSSLSVTYFFFPKMASTTEHFGFGFGFGLFTVNIIFNAHSNKESGK